MLLSDVVLLTYNDVGSLQSCDVVFLRFFRSSEVWEAIGERKTTSAGRSNVVVSCGCCNERTGSSIVRVA